MMDGKTRADTALRSLAQPVQRCGMPAVSVLLFSSFNAGRLSMIWAIKECMRVDVLPFISTDELVTLDRIEAFEGLFGLWAQNRARVRQWVPLLEVITLDVEGQGAS